jgi:hypothetical protein
LACNWGLLWKASMMRIFTTCLFSLVTSGVFAQQSDWKAALGTELKKLDTAQAFTTWQKSAAELEELAKAHPEEWLLQYYSGWAYTQSSFQAPKGEADPTTEKAEPYVRKALALQPENTETLTLMAYWLSSRINASPTRGVKLGSDSKEYADKAIDADSTNPRAYLMKALVIYHTPAVFGGGKKKAEPLVTTAGERFAAFKPATALDPHWGNNIIKQLEAAYKD